MNACIQSIDVYTTRYDPIEAEIGVTVVLNQEVGGYEIRGRLTGPQSPYSETVEVAYPWRMVASEPGLLRARAVIPEACLWRPATPFLYRGSIELWHGQRQVETRPVSHGLRHLVLMPDKLLLNNEVLRLRGVCISRLTAETAAILRAAGCNAILTHATPAAEPTWDAADRFGFLVLGELDPDDDAAVWHVEAHLIHRPSALGWVLPQGVLGRPQQWHHLMSLLHGSGKKALVGIRLDEVDLGVLPGHVSFLLCTRPALMGIGDRKIPRIALSRKSPTDDEPEPKGVIGTIYRRLPDEPAS